MNAVKLFAISNFMAADVSTTELSAMSWALALMIERIPRQLYDRKGPSAVHPGQWAALRYFSFANRNARTISGLAAYLGQTPGPASRAVSSLVKQGFIEKIEHPDDRRSAILSLTGKGRALLKDDPLLKLVASVEALEPGQRAKLAQQVERISAFIHKHSADSR